VNFREGWRGYLWQGRVAAVPISAAHLLAAARKPKHDAVGDAVPLRLAPVRQQASAQS
jgi:hypothetical protein